MSDCCPLENVAGSPGGDGIRFRAEFVMVNAGVLPEGVGEVAPQYNHQQGNSEPQRLS